MIEKISKKEAEKKRKTTEHDIARQTSFDEIYSHIAEHNKVIEGLQKQIDDLFTQKRSAEALRTRWKRIESYKKKQVGALK